MSIRVKSIDGKVDLETFGEWDANYVTYEVVHTDRVRINYKGKKILTRKFDEFTNEAGNLVPNNITETTNLLDSVFQEAVSQILGFKNSIVEDNGDYHLKNDVDSPGNDKMYGTNAIGQKGWYDVPAGGDTAYVNKGHTYKALSLAQPGINVSTSFFNLFYDAANAGSYDNTMFSPVANGVQLLKDLEHITIIGNSYVVATTGSRIALGLSVAINGVPSNIESGGYIRRTSGHDEDQFQIIETFDKLNAGDVITIQAKRTAATGIANGIAGKGFLSIQGLEPDSGSVLVGFPTPVITSITLN